MEEQERMARDPSLVDVNLEEEEEEDITGTYNARYGDRDILLQHDLSEKLIADAQSGSLLRKIAVRPARFKKNSNKRYKKVIIDDDRESDEDDIEVDAETHLRNLRIRQRRLKSLKFVLYLLLCLLILGVIGAGAMKFLNYRPGILGSLTGGQSSSYSEKDSSKPRSSNGTHDFFPTTIYVSLDGFRPDYLSPEKTPAMYSIYTSYTSTPFMYPSFPSVTFPNHYTLVTGLYPSSHGIVGNTFWDPDLKEEFNYHNPAHSLDEKWWKGEPIWVTATNQGIRTGIHMWPGSEVPWDHGEPEYVDKFNQSETLDRKVNRVLSWLDEDIKTRPELILCYVPTIDSLGHKYGTHGNEIDTGLKQVDSMIASIFNGLSNRNLTSIVNVVIVSDHGMASTSNDRLIFLDDFVAPDSVEHIDGWPLFGIRPYSYNTTEEIFSLITHHRGSVKSESLDHWKAYLKDELPSEWHFGGPSGGQYQDRIAPIWLVPEAGWAITTKERFEKQNHDFKPKGLHGFNNTDPQMRAIFLATGPKFESKYKAEPFYNIEMYEIICKTLNITAAANNGSLHGSLKQLSSDWKDPIRASTTISLVKPVSTLTISAGSEAIPTSYYGVLDKGPDDFDSADAWWKYLYKKLDTMNDDINDWLENLNGTEDI
ncbi:alkaline-phosphatase-like protein [Dipodascopsis uninucleata]